MTSNCNLIFSVSPTCIATSVPRAILFHIRRGELYQVNAMRHIVLVDHHAILLPTYA